jgi:hypothetical protein
MKRTLVILLEKACTWTHPVTLHGPLAGRFPLCSLAQLSDRLDQRWTTGVWNATPGPGPDLRGECGH